MSQNESRLYSKIVFNLNVFGPYRSLSDKKAKRCTICGKIYVSMPAYAMHLRTHNQNCKCSICGKTFSRPWLLQGHLRTHTGTLFWRPFFLHLYHWFSCILGERPYKCNLCPKAFADKSNLRAHTQTHSNSKPFECRHCGKTFALKSYLYKHEEASCNQSKWRKRLNFHYFLRSWIKHLFKNEYHDIFSFQFFLYKNRYTRGAKWSRKKRNASRYNNVHRGKNQGSLFNSRSTKVLKPSEVKHVLLYLWDLTQNMSLMFLQHVSFLLALPHDSSPVLHCLRTPMRHGWLVTISPQAKIFWHSW